MGAHPAPCDTAARLVPPGMARAWSCSLEEAPAKPNVANKGNLRELSIPPFAAPLTVTSPVTGLPPMQRGNCRRSEVRASMDGLSHAVSP